MANAYDTHPDGSVRSVLSDGKISRAEYVETVDDFVSCVRKQGVDISAKEQFGYFTYEVKDRAADDQIAACSGSIATIEAIYVEVLTNPEAVDYSQLVVSCLRRAGLVSSEYTSAQLDADSSSGSMPFDASDPAFTRCSKNPQTSG